MLITRAFLSLDGIKCYVQMFKGKNRLSCYLICGHLMVICGVTVNFCVQQHLSRSSLIVSSGQEGLGSQRVKLLLETITRCFNLFSL